MADDQDDAEAGSERDVLTFLGMWARLQDRMDWMVKSVLRSRLPELGDVISDRFMGRLNHADRMTLFKAAAKDVDYTGDLRHFTGAFNRAMRVRDFVAHFDR